MWVFRRELGCSSNGKTRRRALPKLARRFFVQNAKQAHHLTASVDAPAHVSQMPAGPCGAQPGDGMET